MLIQNPITHENQQSVRMRLQGTSPLVLQSAESTHPPIPCIDIHQTLYAGIIKNIIIAVAPRYVNYRLRKSIFISGTNNNWLDLKCEDFCIQTSQLRRHNGIMEIRHTPQFKTWSCDFSLIYVPDVLKIEYIRSLLECAGRDIGIGERRPEKGGDFGRFTAYLCG